MHGFMLQDWITVRGGATAITVTQPESDWLDLEPFQDVVAWVHNVEASGAATLVLQTSPTKDDVLFQNVITPIALTSTGGLSVVPAFMTAAVAPLVPLARYLRWQLSGTNTWDATFRIAIAANSPGI